MTTDALNAEAICCEPFDYAIDTDPHSVWKRMRDEQPVYWNERFDFCAFSRLQRRVGGVRRQHVELAEPDEPQPSG